MRHSTGEIAGIPKCTIRPMDAREGTEIAQQWRRSRLDATRELEERLNHSLEDVLSHFTKVVMSEYEAWVAVEAGSIVGMMAKKDSDLDKLYVEPNSQRRGVGAQLLNKANIDSPSGLALCTQQANTKARSSYESRGFLLWSSKSARRRKTSQT
jgi:GNAT superfamily N-acetyltransferase